MNKERVLILCTGNSARSQMAQGLLRHLAGDRFDVESAGTKPGTVRPEAIAVMREIGIDIAGHWSKHLDEFAGQHFDYVLTVCDHANETCPIFPGAQKAAMRTPRQGNEPAALGGARSTRPPSCASSFRTTIRIHQSFEDPPPSVGSDEERLTVFRRVRDQLREYLKTFPA